MCRVLCGAALFLLVAATGVFVGGHTQAACVYACELMQCRTHTGDAMHPCRKYQGDGWSIANAPNPAVVIARDPIGGTRTSMQEAIERFKCIVARADARQTY